MKKIFFIATIAITFASCTSNQGADAEQRVEDYAEYVDETTTITFDKPEYNFGSVVDGDMVKHTFSFINTGEKELVIFDVKTTCGCTVPEDWPKHPIAPGEGGEIKVIFNSHNKTGMVSKSIRIEANTDPSVTSVAIVGEVKPAE